MTTALIIAVPAETVPGEHRVALVPDVAGRLVKQGAAVRIQAGAGAAAHFRDEAYTAAGCTVVADVTAHLRGEKKIAFKMKRRKGYHRTVGHRQELTRVKITNING